MAQHDYVIANGTGAAVRSDLNNALAAIVSQNSGATAPATTYAFQFWADTTTGLLKLRNSANSAWITLFQLDGEWSTLPVENGTAAAPSIYFKDSGTDTGFYSPGTDQVGISTGGTGRLFINSSGSVGIGTSSVGAVLHTKGAGGSSSGSELLRLETGQATGGNWISFWDASARKGYIGYKETTDDNIYITNEESGGNVIISGSAKLGIGTTSPGVKLDCDGTIRVNTTGATSELDLLSKNGQASLIYWGEAGVNDRGVLGFAAGSGDLVYRRGANSFASGTECFRVDSSSRLLVGTSTARTGYAGNTPEVQIEAAKASDSVRFGLCNNSNGVQDSQILLAKTRGTSVGSNTVVQDGDTLGRIAFLGADGTDLEVAAQISSQVDGTPGNNDMPGRLVFSTTADGASSPTERMRITNDGVVRLGDDFTTAPASTTSSLVIRNGKGGNICEFNRTDNIDSNFRDMIVFRRSSTTVGQINCSNTATQYNTSSDYRLKENVTTITDGIARLQQLKPSRFNFIANPGHTVDGFIAHEVQAVVPEAIHGEKDAEDADGNPIYQGIDQSKLVPLLTAALQEAIGEIESLKARVAALESA